MFAPSREQVRQFFFDLWAKYRAGQPLVGAENTALEAVLAHPEYHALLEQPERFRDRDWLPEDGQTNPFLHLSMHLAIAEQLSVDQPPGIRARYTQLVARHGNEMDAQHTIMDCLGEMIWQAQRHGSPYDSASYLRCLDERLREI